MLEGSTLSFYQDEENTSPMVGQENVEKLRLAGDSVLDFVHIPEDKSKLVFLVKGGGGGSGNDSSFTFSCDGGRDNDEWIERIQETIESIKRRSEHELAGFLPGQSSVMSTPTTRNGDTATCMERGTPLGSDGRLQMSAPSLPSSEQAFSRPSVPVPPPPLQQQQQQQQQQQPIFAPPLVPLPSSALSTPNPHTLHLPSSITRTQPASTTTATPPHAPLAQYPHQQQQQHQQQHDVDGTPVQVSSSQLPTPWGEAADEEGKRNEDARRLSAQLPPTPGVLRKDASYAGYGGGDGGGVGEGGREGGMDETTAGLLAVTFRTLPPNEGGLKGEEKEEAEVKPTVGAAPSRGGLTMSALEELAGGKRRPNPDREDMISMEERKQRVEEGMRRTASASRDDAGVSAEGVAAAARGGSSSIGAFGEGVRKEGYQGWVKMSRRKWYMVLVSPGMPATAATAAVPTAAATAGAPTGSGIAATSSATTSSRMSSPSTAGLTGRESFPRLALYPNPTDLQSHKPPRETIVLTADCIVESRRLPIAATSSSSIGGGGGGGNSSSGRKTSTSSFSTPSTVATPCSFSTELLEPDTVIDLMLTSSRTGLLKTITLQCFTVEEENRWISELQQAIGALTGEEEYEGSPGFLGGVGSLSRELSEHILPSVCCTLS